MGRKSSVNLDQAIKTLVLLKENRSRLVKLKKHLVLAAGHIEAVVKVIDQVIEK